MKHWFYAFLEKQLGLYRKPQVEVGRPFDLTFREKDSTFTFLDLMIDSVHAEGRNVFDREKDLVVLDIGAPVSSMEFTIKASRITGMGGVNSRKEQFSRIQK